MKPFKPVLLCSTVIAVWAVAVPAYSQNAGSPGETESVTVTGFVAQGASTATKLDVPVRDIPMSVSAYTQDFMKSIQTTNIANLYQYMTGIKRSGDTGYDMVIRGFATTAADRNAILTDGMPGLAVRFGSPPTIGVDHIEVVKGSSSILYGQQEPGGFLNIVTKKPLDYAFSDLRVITTMEERPDGAAGGVVASADFSGPIDKDGKFLYRVVGELGNVSHFRDYTYERPIYLAPSFSWKIDDATNALVQFEYRHTQTSYDAYLATPNLDITKVASIYTTYQQPTDNQKETGETVTFTLSHEFFYGIVGNIRYRHVSHQDTANGFDVVAFRPGNTTLQRRARGQINYRYYDFGDTYFTIPFDSLFWHNNVVVGAQMGIEKDDFARTQFFNAPAPPSPQTADIALYNPNYATALPLTSYPIGTINDRITPSTESGAYINDMVTFSDQFKAMLGLRYAEQLQKQTIITPGAATTRTRKFNDNLLPMVGLIYQPTTDLSFYGSYSTAFIPQLASAQDVNGNNNFSPVKGVSWEVGTKDTFLDGKASVTLALFHIKESNVLNSFSCPIGTCSAPVGAERVQGVELEFSAHPLPGWEILSGYAYLDAHVLGSNTATQIGAKLANVPAHDFHVWSRYDFSDDVLPGFGIGAGLAYVSDRKGTLPAAASTAVLDLPGYTTVDTAVYYRLGEKWDFSFKVANLFDETYYQAAGSGGALNIQPGLPRNYTLSIDVHL